MDKLYVISETDNHKISHLFVKSAKKNLWTNNRSETEVYEGIDLAEKALSRVKSGYILEVVKDCIRPFTVLSWR